MNVDPRSKLRWPILTLTAVFVTCLMLAASIQFLPTAEAKGPVKPRDESSGAGSSGSQQTSPPPSQQETRPAPPTERRDESRPSSGSDVFGNRRENRDEQPSARDSSERRNDERPSVGGEALRREERRDPEYEYRSHYYDSFWYPYDRHFWSSYPYYDRGTVVIIDDSWRGRHRGWSRDYTYRSPLPGSLEEALCDIEATWWESEPEFLMWHIDPVRSVDILYKGEFSHSLSPRQIYKLTREAVDRARTTEFRFTSVEKDGYEARAVANHEFDGPDGKHRTAKLVYYLEKDRDRWLINRIDFSKTNYGSPKCFIATAAYGTAMEDEVLTLRQFRDRFLLPDYAGKQLVDLYYTVSPPIADSIRESQEARAIVRALLWPVVQACKVVVGR